MFVTIQFPEGKDNGQFEMFRYPGGEVQVRLTEKQIAILTNPLIHKVNVIARIKDGDIMPVAQLISAIKGIPTAPITLILPYLPYARADRRFSSGDCFGISVFGSMLSMMVTDVVTLDVHSPIAKQHIRFLTDVSPKPIIDSVIDSIERNHTAVGILLPDKGAQRYGIKTKLIASKVRDAKTGKLTGFCVPSKEEFAGLDAVLIVDDICDGGGTFLGIADAMSDYGLDLYLYVTHGIFSKGLTDLFKRFAGIYTTDSYGTSIYASSEDVRRLTFIPCTGTIFNAIENRSDLYKAAEREA